ncbi:hypothetical protein JR334_04260 [Clostridia bacterium]|nr:hypothetical protein JR334_04260 [Clostridia bacterium]
MFKLLRNKKVMRVVVAFVAFSFLGGFVGSYALRSLGQVGQSEAQENDFADELDNAISSYEGDIEYYQNATVAEPENVDNYILLADSYYNLANLRNSYKGEDVSDYLTVAKDNYQKALELDDSRVNLLLSIGMLETALNNYADAADYYETFLEQYPDSFEANALYTQLLVVSDELSEAKDWLEKTRDLATSEEDQQVVEQLEGMVNPS